MTTTNEVSFGIPLSTSYRGVPECGRVPHRWGKAALVTASAPPRVRISRFDTRTLLAADARSSWARMVRDLARVGVWRARRLSLLPARKPHRVR
eukprot:1196420-Prorocentrum_minimum.AAC.15